MMKKGIHLKSWKVFARQQYTLSAQHISALYNTVSALCELCRHINRMSTSAARRWPIVVADRRAWSSWLTQAAIRPTPKTHTERRRLAAHACTHAHTRARACVRTLLRTSRCVSKCLLANPNCTSCVDISTKLQTHMPSLLPTLFIILFLSFKTPGSPVSPKTTLMSQAIPFPLFLPYCIL